MLPTCPTCDILQLWNCDVGSMPSDFNIQKLVILKLGRTNMAHVFINHVSIIDESIGNLKNLVGLKYNFRLENQPDSIGKLSSLKKLDVSWTSVVRSQIPFASLILFKSLILQAVVL